MPIVEILANLNGDAALDAEASSTYAVSSTLAGSSSQTAATVLVRDGAAVLASSSQLTASTGVTLEGTASAAGQATVTATAAFSGIPVVSIEGNAELTADATFLGAYGVDSYGGSPYGGALPRYGLESASALSSTQVRLRYTAMFDADFPLLLALANHSIQPPLVINSIELETAQSVILNTEVLAQILYTVTISTALGYLRQPLDPTLNSAQFLGVLGEPSFYAVATAEDRVRAVFSEPMLRDSLADVNEYRLTEIDDGNPEIEVTEIPITSVTIEQSAPNPARSTVLHLGQSLVHARHYQLTVLSGIVSLEHAPITPNTSAFQWVGNILRSVIPVDAFSGEVQYGLYGIHNGLVFFSPALETAAANSTIEVDQVDVCTRAYDEYHPPQPLDPLPLFTHGLGVVPTSNNSVINSADWVLWAAFPRLVEARIELGGSTTVPYKDSVRKPTDTSVTATTQVIWPADRVSLLNGLPWKLFEVDGNTASVEAATPELMTVTGLTGMTYVDVGKILTIQQADNPVNNGNFPIVEFLSSSSVIVASSGAVGADLNNGHLVWTKPGAFITADNLSPFPPPGPPITVVLLDS